MDEGHAAAPDSGARGLVDQLQADRLRLVEGLVDVLDRVGHVVDARALLGEELADRSIRSERGQQLDVALADVEQYGFDSLGLDGFAVYEFHLETALVKFDGGVEILDRDADVVYALEHCAKSREKRSRAAAAAAR